MIDLQILKKLFRLGQRHAFSASPNPAVVAAIVKANQIIATGIHLKAGTDHAELVALKKAGKAAEGATLYITLEPCTHFGKTPACVDAIIQAKIKRVVYAVSDPNPKVQARSAQAVLSAAGIEVVPNVMPKQAARLHRVFFTNILAQRPYVMLKIANTLDGKIATAQKESMYLTGPKIRRWVHQQREAFAAVMVGIGTVLADDPQLTVRHKRKATQPAVIICDRQAKMPLNARLLKETGRTVYWVIDKKTEIPELLPDHLEVIRVQKTARGLDLKVLLSQLYQRGVYALMCEGGQGLFSSFIEAGLADELAFCVAPCILPHMKALPAFNLDGEYRVKHLPSFDLEQVKAIEDDVLLRYSLKDAPYKSSC